MLYEPFTPKDICALRRRSSAAAALRRSAAPRLHSTSPALARSHARPSPRRPLPHGQDAAPHPAERLGHLPRRQPGGLLLLECRPGRPHHAVSHAVAHLPGRGRLVPQPRGLRPALHDERWLVAPVVQAGLQGRHPRPLLRGIRHGLLQHKQGLRALLRRSVVWRRARDRARSSWQREPQRRPNAAGCAVGWPCHPDGRLRAAHCPSWSGERNGRAPERLLRRWAGGAALRPSDPQRDRASGRTTAALQGGGLLGTLLPAQSRD
eukprot:808052-Prymnesium_polylepis.1